VGLVSADFQSLIYGLQSSALVLTGSMSAIDSVTVSAMFQQLRSSGCDARPYDQRVALVPTRKAEYDVAERAWVRSLPIAGLRGNGRLDMHFGHLNSARVG
jgi:hypothetical protein